MNPIEVNNETTTEVDEHALMRLAQHVLASLAVNPMAELSLVLVDEDAMAGLHQQWMELPGPTDVMAFPMDGEDGALAHGRSDPSSPGGAEGTAEPALLGDVVLCPSVAAKQAQEAGHGTDSELFLLTTHGILHLLGYDHAEPEEEARMFGTQAAILASWTAEHGGEPIKAPRAGTGATVRDTVRDVSGPAGH